MEQYAHLIARFVQQMWMDPNLFEGKLHISASIIRSHILLKLFQLIYLHNQSQ
jgi:hypothetical protein